MFTTDLILIINFGKKKKNIIKTHRKILSESVVN